MVCSHCPTPTQTPIQTLAQTRIGSIRLNSNLCLCRCLCIVNTSTQFYTTHFLSVSVSASVSGSVNVPLNVMCWKLLETTYLQKKMWISIVSLIVVSTYPISWRSSRFWVLQKINISQTTEMFKWSCLTIFEGSEFYDSS